MAKVHVNLRITPDSVLQIDKWAKENNITRTEQIQRMLDWAIRIKESNGPV